MAHLETVTDPLKSCFYFFTCGGKPVRRKVGGCFIGFFTRFLVLFVKRRRLKVAETRPMNAAAVLCPAVCKSDVMEKRRIRGKGIKIRHEPDFFCSSLVKSEPALLLGPSELKVLLLSFF